MTNNFKHLLVYSKAKIFNYFTTKGKKQKIASTFFKSSKLIQKLKTKNHKNLFKLSIINATSVVQLKQLKQRNKKVFKEFPFILSKKNRFFLSLKFIILNLKTEAVQALTTALRQKIILITQFKFTYLTKYKTILDKKSTSKKKHLYFRWFY